MASLQLKTYSVHVHKNNLPEGQCTLAFMTDFHNGGQKRAEQILKGLDHMRPDLILTGGDMLVGKENTSYASALSLMTAVSEKYPVVYAFGNHEYRMCLRPQIYGPAGREYENHLTDLGITILRNTSETFMIRSLPLTVTGLEIPARYYAKFKRQRFPEEEMFTYIDRPGEDSFQILLAHNPIYADTYFSGGYDLILSGHMHGGIIRIFGHPLIGTDGHFFPSCGYGKIDRGHSTMIISSGLGEHTIPIRLFNPRELNFIIFKNTHL